LRRRPLGSTSRETLQPVSLEDHAQSRKQSGLEIAQQRGARIVRMTHNVLTSRLVIAIAVGFSRRFLLSRIVSAFGYRKRLIALTLRSMHS